MIHGPTFHSHKWQLKLSIMRNCNALMHPRWEKVQVINKDHLFDEPHSGQLTPKKFLEPDILPLDSFPGSCCSYVVNLLFLGQNNGCTRSSNFGRLVTHHPPTWREIFCLLLTSKAWASMVWNGIHH